FTLLVHELATNATKYGALSRAGGRIAVEWTIEEPAAAPSLRFRWFERGGPAVMKPNRRGFGRFLIEKAAAREFGAEPRVSFDPEGLAYEIKMPLSAVATTAPTGNEAAKSA
ncbi:MAG TPA: sensor histidine kinase, partial [Gammaproteobacteria bacterium]|nr:sensor histidine kinase [Gammaproteobacteria bacterium]